MIRAAGVVFFAYIGFDAVSTAAQEAKNPQKDMPVGILLSLGICTVLYILMSLVLTGVANYTTLNVPHPVAFALENIPALSWLTYLVEIGAIMGLASVVLGDAHGPAAHLLLDGARWAAPAGVRQGASEVPERRM